MTHCSVCGSKGSTLTSTDDLDATQQARFQEQHAEKPTGSLFCALCVRYFQPAPFFARKKATSSGPSANTGTNEGIVSSVSTAAKKTKLDQPKKPCEKKHVAKHVTVHQRVEKYGKYGLYNDNNLLMCKCCGKKVDHQREDNIRSHITTPLHDQNCEKHVRAAAPYVLAPGYEDRVKQRNQREANKQERQRKRLLGEYNAQKWDEKREKEYRANQLEVQLGKRAKFNTERDVQLPHNLSERLTVQQVLKPKDPRLLSDDMVFTLLRHGRSLELMDEMRPLWRTYNAVGGHVCGKHQAEDYVRPTIIKQEQEGVLFKICDDVDRGSDLSLLFDETTDCTDDHPVNIILGTRCRFVTSLLHLLHAMKL